MADEHLLDLPVEEINHVPVESREVEMPTLPSQMSRDTFAVLLKHLGSMTGTELAINDETGLLIVSAKDSTTIQHALDHISNLNTALTLIQRFQENHHHHLFAVKGYSELEMLPFPAHTTAATIHALSTTEEWDSVSGMTVFVPRRVAPRKQIPPVTPRSATPSRDWKDYSFQGFGSGKVTVVNTSAGSGSSISSAISQRLDTVSKLPPKGSLSLTAPERADRVKTWVNQSTEAEPATAPDLIEIQSMQPSLNEKPAEEQKVVPGLLRRRPKPKTHETMGQQTAPGTLRATKQLTLEDCWLNALASFKLGSKDTQPDSSHKQLSTEHVEHAEQPTATTIIQKAVAKAPIPVMKISRRGDAHQVEEIFDAMQPALEAAKCFPGKLDLEIHVELIAVAPVSDYRNINKDISLDEWKEFFQPKDSRPLASFWVWRKLTASGVDVDSIVDLKWSNKRAERMFEEQAADRGVVYELRCRSKQGLAFVVSLDEHGQASFQQAESALGSSTMHFPHRTWDLNLILRGATNFYHHRQDPFFAAALNDFVKSIWFQPGDSLTMYCSEPVNGLFSVDRIFMKRWTRHRHLSVDGEAKSGLMLKVLEVQEFALGRNPSHPTVVRGRIPILERQQWASKKRLWFEVSIVSDEIQKLLASNKDLELGKKTQKWNPEDLLGEEVYLKNIPVESNPVAMAIGSCGLGNMFRLGKTVLDRMKIGDD